MALIQPIQLLYDLRYDLFMRLGFAILSHESDGRLPRLVARLQEEYPGCKIAIHHDFAQAPIDRHGYPKGVEFVLPSIRTYWATSTVVRGALKAFDLLWRHEDLEWFFLLSASDYPVMSGHRVVRALGSTSADVLIDVHPIDSTTTPSAAIAGTYNPKLHPWTLEANRKLKYKYNFAVQIWIPVLRRNPLRLGRSVVWLPMERHPFTDSFGCFYGDAWFACNRRAVNGLLDRKNHVLFKHLRFRSQVDETYYATVFANNPDLVLDMDTRRFEEWGTGGWHPHDIKIEMLPEIFSSGAFFARKVQDDRTLLAAIDKELDRQRMEDRQ